MSPKSLFAAAVFLGGALGYFFPGSFIFLFGWPQQPAMLSLIGLGIMSGGFLLFEFLRLRTELAIFETLIFAGVGTVLVFLKNFGMGYAPGMAILTLFAAVVALFGIYLRYRWR